MKHPRILVDASNLHVGGGVQVAASFIDELLTLQEEESPYPWLDNIHFQLSTRVTESLRSHPKSLTIRDSRPYSLHRWIPLGPRYDLMFVLFGPFYGRSPAQKMVLGYADGLSIYGYPNGSPKPRIAQVVKQTVRSIISRRLLSNADIIITETQAMKDQVLTRTAAGKSVVHVVPNAYNSIFDRPEDWGDPIADPWLHGRPDLAFVYVSRLYPHKNFRFIGQFINHLNDMGFSATCLVTLREDEMKLLDAETLRHVTNVGPLPMDRVPRLYQKADVALFPSLLETFSVMPLEAMRMGIPIIASDRDFVRTTAQDGPFYIDPLDPRSAADLVVDAMRRDRLQQHIVRGIEIVDQTPNARQRALAYLELINDAL